MPRQPKVDYAQVADDICDDEDRCPSQPVITDTSLRSDGRLRHLLTLRRGERRRLLEASEEVRQQLYLLRKADEKVEKLARKNRKLSVQHCKGERRQTHRLGAGKSGSCRWWALENEDIDAALELAHASTNTSQSVSKNMCEPFDIYAVLELIESHGASLWDEAVQKAELDIMPSRRNSLLFPGELKVLLQELQKTGDAFDALRVKFLQRHGKALLDSLDQCTTGRTLKPAPVAREVQERFLAVCGNGRHFASKISAGFHGTPGSVHESIFSKGLLIPGQNNDLVNRNGTAHGNGVYIAKLNNPWLSQGFAHGTNKMLVCGVMDDAVNLRQVARLGSFGVTKKSDNVRHVGDAMVVFESACVAPLFVAEWKEACRNVAPSSQKRVRQPRSRNKCHGFTKYCHVMMHDRWAWEANKHKRGLWLKEHRGQLFTGRRTLLKFLLW